MIDSLCPVIRHQPPPIVPTLVHSLKAKEYPQEQINAFDDEVPYAKGVISPRMARQTANKKRVISSASPSALAVLPSPSDKMTASTVTSALMQPRTNHSVGLSESRTSSSSRTARTSAYTSALISHAPLTNHPIVASKSSPQTFSSGTHGLPSAKSDSPSGETSTGITVEDVTVSFEYSAGPSSPYWSNSESTQSLQASLSGLAATDVVSPS
jgi:hypothetical protein